MEVGSSMKDRIQAAVMIAWEIWKKDGDVDNEAEINVIQLISTSVARINVRIAN